MQNREETNVSIQQRGNPNHPQLSKDEIKAIYDRIFKLRLENKSEEALNLLERFINDYPAESIFIVMRADVYKLMLNKEKDQEAIDDLRAVISREPNNVYALTVLGEILRYQEEQVSHFEALGLLEKACQIDPQNAHAFAIRGDILTVVGNFNEAIFYLGRALKLDPNNALTRFIAARYYYEYIDRVDSSKGLIAHCKKKMLQHLDCAIQITPYYKNALIMRGSYFLYYGDFDFAIDCLTKALEANPHDIKGLRLRARAYKRRAEHNFLFSKGKTPYTFISEFEGHIQSGACFEDLTKALVDLEKVFEKKPDDSIALLIQADVYKLLGKNELAIKILEEYLNNYPNDSFALLIRGEIELKIDHLNALEYFQKAIKFAADFRVSIKDCVFLMHLANACIILANNCEEDNENEFCDYIQKAFEFYQYVLEQAPHLVSLKTRAILTLLNSDVMIDSDFFDKHEEVLRDCLVFENVLDAWREKKNNNQNFQQ